MSVTLYCTANDLADRASSAGVTLRLDDAPPDTASVLRRAAVKVNGYCQLLYSVTALAGSAWITEHAADIALYYLCGRRNNPVPKSVQKLYDDAIKDLEGIRAGYYMIPDAAQRKANVPVLSNLRVAAYPVPHAVVVEGTSTGSRENYPVHPDNFDFLDYTI